MRSYFALGHWLLLRDSASSAWRYQSCSEGFECTQCALGHTLQIGSCFHFSWYEQNVSYLVIIGIFFFSCWFLSGVTAPRLNARGLCSCINVGIFIYYYYFSILNSSFKQFQYAGSQINGRVVQSLQFEAAAIAFFFTFCVYGIMITREISVFLYDTPVLLVTTGRGAFVYIAVSSFFLVSCSLPVSCYVIFCFLVSSRCSISCQP